jgi:hypothetical protein
MNYAWNDTQNPKYKVDPEVLRTPELDKNCDRAKENTKN